MKKWMYAAAALIGVALLARLPHPAKDIAELKPVRAVYLYMGGARLCMETDTGDSGSGRTLTEAAERMKAAADGEIFLDTAEFLILGPGVTVEADFFDLLRPDCRVARTEGRPELETVSEFLSIHKPEQTLRELRAERSRICNENSIPSGSWRQWLRRWPSSPAPAG